MTGMPPIAVLAGGLATRMRPLTEQLPKALLEVAGEPFIAHQLRLFAREGITDVKLLVGYCWEQIELFVGEWQQIWGKGGLHRRRANAARYRWRSSPRDRPSWAGISRDLLR